METVLERSAVAAAAKGWIDQPEQRIYDWLRDNIELDATSPIQGPYDVGNSPQLRDPLLTFQDETVRMVTTIGPNQGGRTQAMLGGNLWAIVNRPGPMQWNTSKDETAKEFAEQKWWPTAKACAPIVAKLPAHGTGLGHDRHKERIRSIIFSDGMPFKKDGYVMAVVCSHERGPPDTPRHSTPLRSYNGNGVRSEVPSSGALRLGFWSNRSDSCFAKNSGD